MALYEELDLDRPFSDVRHEAVLNIVHTANLVASVGAALFRKFDLTEAQFNALFALKNKEREVTQSDLGKRLVVSRAGITSILDRLEKKGLVVRKRVPGNRRVNHVELTSKGDKLVAKLEPRYRRAIHAATAGLNAKECRTLIEYLERVRTETRK